MAENDPLRDAVAAAANREVFSLSRESIGAIVFGGDLLVAVGVPVALRGHAPLAWLIAWGAAIATTSYLWEWAQRLFPDATRDNDRLRDRWGWVSTVAWAALPWVVIGSIESSTVAWVLVFVVALALGTDLLFTTQSDAPSIDAMMAFYTASYVAALAIGLHLIAMGAVILAGATWLMAARAWSDVSDELLAKRIESEHRSRVDALTGLGTRTAAIEAVERMDSTGVEQIHCAFIDIDDFKHLNDNHGHAVGDDVLIAVGARISEALPPTWVVARFGGDEFVATGPEWFDFQQVIEAEIRLDHDLALEIAQSLSVGVTCLPGATATAEDLFREAAAALRLAKRLGKHQVIEMNDELRELEDTKAVLARQIGRALEVGEIVPWAQTIVDLETAEPVGFELLARWIRPNGEMVAPGEFVPVIEDQGRGPDLGMRMIRHAIDALADPSIRNTSIYVSVNVSARHLYHRRLPAEILGLLGRHGVAPERLVLEITESQHLPSSPIWRETADQLRTLGIGLAMDDFGTGYASMEQLLHVPFTHVKIDRVISAAYDRPGGVELASAVAAMADGAGMHAIVEGVETAEQRRAMQIAGYRTAQGFHFHRPAPLDEVIQTVARANSQPRQLHDT